MNIADTLTERGARYGASYAELSAISQGLKDTLRATPNWQTLPAEMRESLELIALKLARILYGDPTYADNWVDIAGYATLVVDELEGGHG